jgi:glycogen operon protein
METTMHFRRSALATLLGCIFSAAPAVGAINASKLGASYDATRTSVTFKIFSSRATRIELYLYSSATGTAEQARYVMNAGAGGVWSASIPVATLNSQGLSGTLYYGYRAWGPNWPYNATWIKGAATGFISDVDANGNRFNPNKLLTDPYALELSHDPTTSTMSNGTIYASGAAYRNIDSGSSAPKGIVLAGDTQAVGSKPTRAFKDDVVYEVHVRGLTRNDPSINAAYRGTYKGAGLKAAYLASLGVTADEFLPVQETQNDTNDSDPNSDAGDNYWGYSTLSYFAPDRR